MQKTNHEKLSQQTGKKILVSVLQYLCIQFTLIFACCSTCFAEGPNYAEDGARWLLGQLFWVAVVVFVIILIKCAVARNTVACVVTIIVGAGICFFIKKPEIFETIGDAIANAVGLQ